MYSIIYIIVNRGLELFQMTVVNTNQSNNNDNNRKHYI